MNATPRHLAFLTFACLALVAGLASAQAVPGSPSVATSGSTPTPACSTTAAGTVPATGGGTAKFLRSDCTFATPTSAVSAGTTNAVGVYTSATTIGPSVSSRSFFDGAATNYLTADSVGTVRVIIVADSASGQAWLQATSASGNLVCGAVNSSKATGLGGTLPNLTDTFCSSFAGDFYLLASAGSSNGVRLHTDGGWGWVDQVAPAGASGFATAYSDSTSHTGKLSNGGDSFDDFARSVTGYSAVVTNATTTYADVLSVSLAASSKYHCAVDGVFRETVAADGAKVRVNPGATSVTSDAIHGELYDGDTLLGGGVLNSTGSGFDVASAGTIVELADTTVTAGHFVWSYNVSTSAAMTWKLQAAQQAHTTGTLTVEPGATVTCSRL